ncbi:MAG TPA: hypothetical protein VEV44_05070 [Pseudoneobacillus sp.]|nr:hypothetical protein [Pseudoneobacillus sp.]
MVDNNPIEFTGKVLDQRNTLTGPDADKANYPKTPKHVPIQNQNNKTEQ